MAQIRRINDYYTSTAADYEEFWVGERDLAMHLGYYDSNIESHAQSLEKMNEVLSALVGISPEDRVLDAGCGYGGSAIWLAAHIGCEVEGVNVVLEQLKAGRRRAAGYGLVGKVRFSHQDYSATNFPDGSFDVVWALESVIHTENKAGFFAETARLLKAGGRILVADCMLKLNRSLSSADERRLRQVESGWAVASPSTPSQYQDSCNGVGFDTVQFSDLTESVRQSMRRLGDLCRAALPEAKEKLKAGLWNRTRYENVVASICMDELFDSGMLKYIVMTARKA
jgi:tocopherol O-methyltransferase